MKKTLTIATILILAITLPSCRLALGEFPPTEDSTITQQASYATLDCVDSFSINGKVYTAKKAILPVTIYNPNLYSIDVMVNGSATLSLRSHEEKELY